MSRPKLKLIPLGGLGEIGKNMMLLEYADDILVIDCGLMFPEEDMLGIDLVIPDLSYVVEKRDKIRGIVVTHGHEDHIGALPYLLPQINKVPIYSTKLTQGLIQVKLKERRIKEVADLKILEFGKEATLGKFKIELFPVCHSIPDAAGVIVTTPEGIVVHSGDFKVDYTPVNGNGTDLSRLAQLGAQGVLLLLSDSTYAELPGYTPSEQIVGASLENVIANAPGRVVVTTFSSLISRVQQVIDAAVKHERRVFIVGRSMSETVRMALDMGYLNAPEGILGRIDELKGMPNNRIVMVTTGSQGEPTSALVRMANRDHRHVHIQRGDTIVLSATPVPGNESLVNRTVDSLFKQGAQVMYDKLGQVHVHGHGSQEELKLLLNLVKPRFFVPIHGEYRHLSLHARLGEEIGIPAANIFVLEDGDVLELTAQQARINGKVGSGNVYVDGLSVGDSEGVVLRTRRMLSRDGIVVVIIAVNRQSGKLVGRPDIVTRGFVDTRESRDMMDESRELLAKTLDHGSGRIAEWGFINTKVKDTLEKFYYKKTKRRPMILPFMVKV
ncbi:MAG TPA: ribonuclease J [Dehalococcoidia bacterium]|nr:ribonuclease J [Dehalococcoidia bacterium]